MDSFTFKWFVKMSKYNSFKPQIITPLFRNLEVYGLDNNVAMTFIIIIIIPRRDKTAFFKLKILIFYLSQTVMSTG